EAGDMDVTIHRAFDFTHNQVKALETLKEHEGITTVLTSGGDYKAPEAVEKINHLIDIAKDSHLKIMVGNGLRLETLESFCSNIQPVDALHFGSDVRKNRSPDQPLDQERIQTIKQIMCRFS